MKFPDEIYLQRLLAKVTCSVYLRDQNRGFSHDVEYRMNTLLFKTPCPNRRSMTLTGFRQANSPGLTIGITMFLIVACSPFIVCPQDAHGQSPEIPSAEVILDNLRVEHPRLILTGEDVQQVLQRCQSDETAGRWLQNLTRQADRLLDQPPVEYEIPDGKRLLSVSRRAKKRLLVLGLLYQLTQDDKYARRAWDELDAVIHFKDWNPSHFLDTAEMTFAVAIGYDWLFDAWDTRQREQLRTGIVELGLRPGREGYCSGAWWSTSKHNWNQVCHGGLAVGALAIADTQPELAEEILHTALTHLPLAMAQFAPDGGWGEGPGYWRYATEYNVYLLAALETALATDFGLSQMAGFEVTGDFPGYLVGPSGKTFNFADAKAGWGGAPQWFYLATRFQQPDYARWQLPHASRDTAPLDLVWGHRWSDVEPTHLEMPLSRAFHGVSVISLRSDWNDPRALFVGFKGGDNQVNHGHLDLGTFVLEAQGQRWAVDLGPDNYNLPGYFGNRRWDYFRNNTLSHNTLVIDGQSQHRGAQANVIRFASHPQWSGGIVDLSAAWPQVTRHWRGVALIDNRRVVVQDEIEAEAAVEPVWQMLTRANIEVQGKQAILRLDDHTLYVTLLGPAKADWQVEPVEISPPERPIEGVSKLIARLDEPSAQARFTVVIGSEPDEAKREAIRPLADWPESR